MDKGNNRISIKINGNERSFEDDADSGVKKEVDSSKSTDKEILQPFTYKKETAAAQEEENDEFSWVLPNEDEASSDDGPTKIVQIEDVRNKSKKGNPYFKNTTPKTSSFNRRPSSALKTLLLSIFLAVIVGLGLGAMILNLISEEDHQQAIGTPTLVPAGPGTNDEEGKESSTNAGASALELAPINIAYAQEGVYKNKEAVDDLVKTIKQSGFPSAAVEIGDSYTVVVGIGTDKEIIKEIGKLYETKSGKEPYHKVIEVEGGTFSKANEKDVNYIKDGQAFFTQLSSLSSNSFSAKSISDEQWTSISKLQKELKGKISDDMSDSLKSFSTSLTNAYKHLDSYKKSNDDATLLKSQQELLNAFQFYQQWKLSLS